MFVGITNTPRDYAWGSDGLISGLLGTANTGAPEAELWLGAHPGSPSRIRDAAAAGGAQNLAEWVAADPHTALGESHSRLPFLLKILAAGSPLSLQAHPTSEQAVAGFERENAAGIPLDAPHRNYKDAYPKPELIFALSETFEALCGFRSVAEIRDVLGSLADDTADLDALLERLPVGADDEPTLRSAFEWLISRGDGVDALIERVVRLARANPGCFATVVRLADAYPGDPGIVISLLLHNVTLQRGEALYLPAGNIHAYLDGLGVELMTASDNVLRGGLTPKHVDVPELLEVLDFRPVPVPYLRAEQPAPGVQVFRPDVPDFVLVRIEGEADIPLTGPAIAISVEGNATLAGGRGSATIARGESVYITPDEGSLHIESIGTVFVATTNG